MKKMDTQFLTLTNKDKQHQGTQWCPQEHSQRRNPASNHWEFHGDVTDIVNQNVQDALKQFQDTKNKEYEKTQKQIHELRRALNKHQNETENTINREIMN
jgi:phosphopentomutase